MKTTLDLPDDLMREVKIRAATEGKKLKDVVTEVIRIGLGIQVPADLVTDSAALIHYSSEGFPYIKCKPSVSPPVPFEELQRLIDESQLEEDLQRAGITV